MRNPKGQQAGRPRLAELTFHGRPQWAQISDHLALLVGACSATWQADGYTVEASWTTVPGVAPQVTRVALVADGATLPGSLLQRLGVFTLIAEHLAEHALTADPDVADRSPRATTDQIRTAIAGAGEAGFDLVEWINEHGSTDPTPEWHSTDGRAWYKLADTARQSVVNELGRARRTRLTPEHLQRVADAYTSGRASKNPTATVQATFDVPRSTAERWIRAAESAGILTRPTRKAPR